MSKTKQILLRTNKKYSILSPFKYFMFAFLLFIVLYYVKPFLPDDRIEYLFFGLIIINLVRYIYKIIYLLNITYTITSKEIIFDRGVFSRYQDRIELYRIKDYSQSRTFLMRFINAMKITVITSDKTHPEFNFIGIDKSNILDGIRILVETNRRKHNVYEVD